MSARSPYPVTGPKARDELHCWSTALLADDELGAVPALAAPAPSGWTELVDGRGVHVRRRPGPGNAVPVWFIHGLGGASTDWTRLSAALAPWATGYSLDLPGSGRSDPPPGGSYSPVDDAEFAAAVIDQVSGGPVHVVGNSYGAIVATLLAARRPDLVRTLTVISPAVPDLRLTRDRGADAQVGPAVDARHGRPGSSAAGLDRSAGPCSRHGRAVFRSPGGDQRPGLPDIRGRARLAGRTAVGAFGHGFLPSRSDGRVPQPRVGLLRGFGRGGRRARPWWCGGPGIAWSTCRLSRRAETAYRHGSLLVLAECGHVPQLEDPWTTARGILACGSRSGRPRQRRPMATLTKIRSGAPQLCDPPAVATS